MSKINENWSWKSRNNSELAERKASDRWDARDRWPPLWLVGCAKSGTKTSRPLSSSFCQQNTHTKEDYVNLGPRWPFLFFLKFTAVSMKFQVKTFGRKIFKKWMKCEMETVSSYEEMNMSPDEQGNVFFFFLGTETKKFPNCCLRQKWMKSFSKAADWLRNSGALALPLPLTRFGTFGSHFSWNSALTAAFCRPLNDSPIVKSWQQVAFSTKIRTDLFHFELFLKFI